MPWSVGQLWLPVVGMTVESTDSVDKTKTTWMEKILIISYVLLYIVQVRISIKVWNMMTMSKQEETSRKVYINL